MRAMAAQHPLTRTTHRKLVASVIEAGASRLSPTSPILAGRFKEYLDEVHHAEFAPRDPVKATRHPVSHGVLPVEAFDRKHALLCFLIFHQLMFFAAPQEPSPSKAASAPVA